MSLTNVARFFDCHLGFAKEVTRGTVVDPVTSFIPAKTAKPEFDRERIDAHGADGQAVREVNDDIGGAVTPTAEILVPFRPTAPFEILLEAIAGGTPTGSAVLTYPLANTMPGLTVEIKTKGNAGIVIAELIGAVMGSGKFSSEVNGPLLLQALLHAESMTRETSTSSTFAVDVSERAYVHTDVVLTVGGTTFKASKFEWSWNRNMEVFHANDIQPCDVLENEFALMGSLETKWSDEADVEFAKYISDLPTSIVATYTSGSNVLTFTFNDVYIDKAAWPSLEDLAVSPFTLPFRANRDDTAGTDGVIITMTNV